MDKITENTFQQNIRNLKQQKIGLYGGIFFCAVGLPIFVYTVYLGVIVRQESLMSNAFSITIIVALSIWLRNSLRLVAQVNEQIKNATKETQINATKQEKTQKITAPLSQEDIKILKQEITKCYIIAFITTIMFSVAAYYELKQLFAQNTDFSVVFALAVAVLMTGGIAVSVLYVNTQIQKEIKSGQKEVLMRILTDKYETYDRNTKGIGNKTKYYFHFDGKGFTLDNDIAKAAYYKVEIGQKIVLQRSIYTKTILKIDVLNEAENKTE